MPVLTDEEPTIEEPVASEAPRKRGRPPKIAGEAIPPDILPEVPKKLPVNDRHAKMFEFLGVGDTVEFFEKGDRGLHPMVGLILAKYPESRTFDLIIWCREHRASYGTREGVRHINDPAANKFQVEEVGAWLEKRSTTLLYDLLER